MTKEIRNFIESNGILVCPSCEGEGEIGDFCGHESTRSCYFCAGKGIVASLNKQKHRKDCVICYGEGCLGGCNHRGYHEWESYEIFNENARMVDSLADRLNAIGLATCAFRFVKK